MKRLVVIVLAVTIAAMAREILMDRAPRRGLHGASPVIGSLDTWPTVPRRPS